MLTDTGFLARLEPVTGGRRDLAVRTALTALFTGVQLWALAVVLHDLPVAGMDRMALAAALAAALVAVVDAWRELWGASRRAGRRRQLVWAAATGKLVDRPGGAVAG
jgi:hypothetical protein